MTKIRLSLKGGCLIEGCPEDRKAVGLCSKHYHWRSLERTAYNSAKDRCQNVRHTAYPHYGGRGIEFRFTSFEQFLAIVGRKPSPQHSLDRFPDNDGHYEPGNVRWATRLEQQANRRTTLHITHENQTLTAVEWSRRLGMGRTAVWQRIQKGWCKACAVSLPNGERCPHISGGQRIREGGAVQ